MRLEATALKPSKPLIQLTSFVLFPSAWLHAIHLSKDYSIQPMPNRSRHHIRPRPTAAFSSWQRQHVTGGRPSALLPPSCSSSGCKLHTRCEWRRDFHPLRQIRTVSFPLAFVPKCAATRENFAAQATSDISSLPATILCSVDPLSRAAPFRHSPWGTRD